MSESKESTLSQSTIWIFGVGEVGVSAAHVLYGLFFTTFLLEVAKLNPSMGGTLLIIGQVWDAITAPIIGYLTDNVTRTRWGRRRPWILLATVPFSISFFGIWQAWPNVKGTGAFVYFLFMVLLFNLAGNAIQIPYSALSSDLMQSYDDSIVITRTRMAVGLIGGVVFSLLMSHMIIAFHYPNDEFNYIKGYRISSIIGASLFLIPPLLIFFFIKEKALPPKKIATEKTFMLKIVGQQLLRILKIFLYKPYLILTLVYFLCWTTIQFSQTNLYLFYKYVMNLEKHFQWIIFLIQLVGALSIFLWSMLCEWIDKKYIFASGMTILSGSYVATYFMDQTWPVWSVYMSSALSGLGISTAYLIPWAMVPDIINAYDYKFQDRQEGIFFSVFVLVQKIGVALALALHSYSLGWAGYDNTQSISEYVLKIIRMMASWVPFTALMLSIMISLFYPLGLKKMLTVLEGLNKRETVDENEVPITKNYQDTSE